MDPNLKKEVTESPKWDNQGFYFLMHCFDGDSLNTREKQGLPEWSIDTVSLKEEQITQLGINNHCLPMFLILK